MSEPTLLKKSNRLISLDAFRGITIAGMIMVNNPGSWSAIYPPLRHAAWNGWTPTDFIFPFFLFIVGVAIVYAFANRQATGATTVAVYLKILKRTVLLFAIGLYLSAFKGIPPKALLFSAACF
jgi:predicted acyltransferase